MPSGKTLLIGSDGADWRIANPLIDRGEMPNLERLISGGVMGKLATLQPMLSPMIWTSIATGKMPDRHGVLGFTEVDEDSGEVRPSTSLSRRVKAIWNILGQEGYRSHAVSWFSSHPAEPINGVCVSELFARQTARADDGAEAMPGGVVHPARLRETFADFLVSPREIDAAAISLFVPRFREVDQAKDPRLMTIARILAETFTVHAAATWILENEPWNFLGVYYNAIDHFCHGFLRYHPPRLPYINKAEYELFKDVVNGAYRLQDLLLGRMMELAGDDATIVVCSDHGFQVGDLRPGPLAALPAAPAEEHRPVGVFAMKGPTIRKDELVHGASVLDITPTILNLMGLPVGEDMDGRPLVEAFTESDHAIPTIGSWEDVDGPAGMHPPGTRVEPRDQRALLDQFAALGYVDKEDGRDAPEAAVLTMLERDWNLARVQMNSRQYTKALPILEEIHDRNPLRFDFGMMLAECQFRLGMAKEAGRVVEELAAIYPRQLRGRMLLGLAEYYRGNREAALEHLAAVAEAKPRLPSFYTQLGTVYLLVGRPRKALEAFEEALGIDPDSPAAHLGVAKCRLRLREPGKAAESALSALGLEFSLSEAHWVLGIALARLGKTRRAIRAIEASLRFAPGRGHAHRLLAILYGRLADGAGKAREHREKFVAFRDGQSARRSRAFELRVEANRRANERARRRAEEEASLMAATDAQHFAAAGGSVAVTADAPVRKPGMSGREFVIVSGLPRSGTSMMMQMLEAGGASVMADGERKADESNPEGYYEWEDAKRLLRNPREIEQTEGKVVKVMSLLLHRLPPAHRYKVIFMRRAAEQVVASQARMLERAEVAQPIADRGRLRKLAATHQDGIIQRLGELDYVDLLVVDHGETILRPDETARRVAEFLGPGRIVTPGSMAGVVKPELWRERSGEAERATL